MMVSLTTRVDIGTGSVCGMEVDSYERDFVERRNMGELRNTALTELKIAFTNQESSQSR